MTPDKANSLANDIACTIATLQAIANELMTAYPDSDYEREDETEVETAEAAETEAPPEPSTPAVTLEAVRSVLSEKSRDGMTAQVKGLLIKYGANRLSDIDPVNFAALLADAEGLKK